MTEAKTFLFPAFMPPLRERPGYLKPRTLPVEGPIHGCAGASRAEFRRRLLTLLRRDESKKGRRSRSKMVNGRTRWQEAHVKSAPFRAKKVWALEEAARKMFRGSVSGVTE